MPEPNDDHVAAHKHSIRHRAELEASAICRRFYCMRTFSPTEIRGWTDEGQTALCPYCPVDSVRPLELPNENAGSIAAAAKPPVLPRNHGVTRPELFRDLVTKWKDETGHLSSITKAIAHPSYLRIIGLSRDSENHQIERLLIRELQSEPDHWFAALTAVTGEDPVKPEDDFDEAVEAWLSWGRDRGYID